MTAKRHHYVPQCYLKGFARDRDKPNLYVIDGKTRSDFRTSPANVAAETNFHTIDVEGREPDALESAFSGFESGLAPALNRIIETRSIRDENDRAYLFNLMALMGVKNPQHRESTRKFQETVMKRVMELATATPERWESQLRQAQEGGEIDPSEHDVSYEQMHSFVQEGKFNITFATGFHLQLELGALDAILPYFFGRKWWLLRAPAGKTGFITSDHPVCLMWSDPAERGKFHGPGHGVPGTQIVFPISNELAIMGAFEAQEAESDASDLLIAQINGTLIIHSNRQVYARDSDFMYKLAHNRQIMRGADLLNDQENRPAG